MPCCWVKTDPAGGGVHQAIVIARLLCRMLEFTRDEAWPGSPTCCALRPIHAERCSSRLRGEAMDKWPDVVLELLRSRRAFLLVIGTGLFVLALARGVTYRQWLPIDGAPERALLGAFALILFVLGLLLQAPSGMSHRTRRSLGIRILHPAENAVVDVVDVRGSIAKSLPEGHELRVLRGYPQQGGLVPVVNTTVDVEKGEWLAPGFDIGGTAGDARSIEVWVVGPDGAALLDCWLQAQKAHWATVKQVKRLAPEEQVGWQVRLCKCAPHN